MYNMRGGESILPNKSVFLLLVEPTEKFENSAPGNLICRLFRSRHLSLGENGAHTHLWLMVKVGGSAASANTHVYFYTDPFAFESESFLNQKSDHLSDKSDLMANFLNRMPSTWRNIGLRIYKKIKGNKRVQGILSARIQLISS